MSKSRVFQDVLSPPAPAWRTVNDWIARVEPRSTCRNLVPETSEHHLSLLPPETLPLNAFSGPSLELHGVEPVAGWFSATFTGPVFPPVFSAPRPACLTTNRFTLWLEPRSTVSDDGEVSVQNLLLLTSMPSTALGAVSLVAHAAWGLLTGLFRARFVPSAGGAGGGVNPALNEGGASAEPVPHVLALLLPIVNARVPPAAMSRNRMKF